MNSTAECALLRFFSGLALMLLGIAARGTCENPFERNWKPAERPTPAAFYPRTWNLPLEVNGDNTEVTFKVDSTFKLVTGRPLKPTGRIWLQDPRDPLSVKASIKFPVGSFETGDSSRDEELREIFAEEKFPAVQLEISSLEGVCAPEKAESPIGCTARMKARLTIRDIVKDLTLPYDIRLKDREYLVSGQIPLRWNEYNVEDPSGLFTRVDKTVYLAYRVILPLKESARQ